MSGTMLLLIIVFRPQGILPEKSTKMRGLDYDELNDELMNKGIKIPEKKAKKDNIFQRLLSRRLKD
jgi:hypothetical protein